jgi:hypothetical protein
MRNCPRISLTAFSGALAGASANLDTLAAALLDVLALVDAERDKVMSTSAKGTPAHQKVTSTSI